MLNPVKRVWTSWPCLRCVTFLIFLLAAAAGTDLAVARGPAESGKLDAAALSQIIDQQVKVRLDAEGVKPSPRCDDAEFVRRVYLDLAGVIPPAARVSAFLDNSDPERRSKLIEELLANPLYGKQMSETWTGLLLPRNTNNPRLRSEPLRGWLEQSFNANKPWDKVVHELVTASGPQDKNGAVTFFIGNPGPDKVTDTVSRLFLGVQLQCAQCHNHPFTGWKQNEYWAMAAFFTKVNVANAQVAAKNGASPMVSENGGGGKGKRKGGFRLPDSAKIVPAKFLQGDQPKLNPSEPLRPVLADWMIAPQNRFFARAMANRMWAHFFGRGLVNPVDDMHDDNEPSHPELLAALAEQFKTNGFDVKYLIRAVCNSEAYQRTSRPGASNGDDKQLFSHMAVRALSPEQLYDSLTAALGKGPVAGGPGGKKGPVGRFGPGGPRVQFLNFFRIDEGANPLEYQAGIPQALRLMNSAQLGNGNSAVAEALEGAPMPPQVIERLYLRALSRRPTEAESRRLTEYVGRQEDARAGYGDILWALVNSSEFALNH